MTPSSSLFLASTTNAALALGCEVSGSTHPVTKTLSCCSLIFLQMGSASRAKGRSRPGEAYRIAGGAPAGINILPGEAGCLTNRTSMKTTTMHGKTSTTPSGMDMLELPFNRKGRLKNASLDEFLLFVFNSTIVGILGGVGRRLRARRTTSMTAGGAAAAEEERYVVVDDDDDGPSWVSLSADHRQARKGGTMSLYYYNWYRVITLPKGKKVQRIFLEEPMEDGLSR